MNDKVVISPPTEHSNTVVFFHFPCADGFTAAWAAWRARPTWEYMGISHGDFPTVCPPEMFDMITEWDGGDIYFLDICPPADLLLRLAQLVATAGKKVVVLDHHKTAQADIEAVEHPNLVKVFDMEKSGARLAWEHFHPLDLDVAPTLVRFVEDRDLWRFSDPDTKAFSSFLFSIQYGFEAWDSIHDAINNGELQDILQQGEAIDRKHEKDVEEIVTGPMVIQQDIAGFRVPVVNVPYFYASEVGHALLKDKSAPFAATYYVANDGIRFSLRSEEGRQDVGDIAKLFGGGGHRNAAGFTIQSFDLLAEAKA